VLSRETLGQLEALLPLGHANGVPGGRMEYLDASDRPPDPDPVRGGREVQGGPVQLSGLRGRLRRLIGRAPHEHKAERERKEHRVAGQKPPSRSPAFRPDAEAAAVLEVDAVEERPAHGDDEHGHHRSRQERRLAPPQAEDQADPRHHLDPGEDDRQGVGGMYPTVALGPMSW